MRQITLNELDILARKNSEIPDGLLKYETDYYISVRKLYGYYSLKLCTLDSAKRDKQKIVDEYNQALKLWNDKGTSIQLETRLESVVTYYNSEYILIGITKKQHCYQAILQDIKQPNSEIVANVNDILLEG